jgi:hypothetical protein
MAPAPSLSKLLKYRNAPAPHQRCLPLQRSFSLCLCLLLCIYQWVFLLMQDTQLQTEEGEDVAANEEVAAAEVHVM